MVRGDDPQDLAKHLERGDVSAVIERGRARRWLGWALMGYPMSLPLWMRVYQLGARIYDWGDAAHYAR